MWPPVRWLPGTYTVKGAVKEGKADKPWETADCTASFTVKAYEPPTISCTANPSTIKPGDTSTITSVGVSPQNRPSDLQLLGIGRHGQRHRHHGGVQFNGRSGRRGEITCNVADDKGRTATANTTVTITAPLVPPVPHAQALCSITFDKDNCVRNAGGQRSQGLPGRSGLDLRSSPMRRLCGGRGHRRGEGQDRKAGSGGEEIQACQG